MYCKLPCSTYEITPTVTASTFVYDYSLTTLRFNSKVVSEFTDYAYTAKDFLVESGSAVGLWLGLSVVGMIEIIVLFAQRVEVATKRGGIGKN